MPDLTPALETAGERAPSHGTLLSVDIVEFLEARIAEEEQVLAHAHGDESPLATSLARRLLAECAQKRAIVDYWKRAAIDEGIDDPTDARGTVAVARRTVLSILAAGYRGHPDYPADWRG